MIHLPAYGVPLLPLQPQSCIPYTLHIPPYASLFIPTYMWYPLSSPSFRVVQSLVSLVILVTSSIRPSCLSCSNLFNPDTPSSSLLFPTRCCQLSPCHPILEPASQGYHHGCSIHEWDRASTNIRCNPAGPPFSQPSISPTPPKTHSLRNTRGLRSTSTSLHSRSRPDQCQKHQCPAYPSVSHGLIRPTTPKQQSTISARQSRPRPRQNGNGRRQ